MNGITLFIYLFFQKNVHEHENGLQIIDLENRKMQQPKLNKNKNYIERNLIFKC